MNSQTIINNILSGTKNPTYQFEDIATKLPAKQVMEVYTELAIRLPDFYASLGYVVNMEEDARIKDGYYPYIAFDIADFVQILVSVVKEYNVKSFIDVGAGFGDKVNIASKFVKKSHGIEYLDSYVRQARKFGVTLIKADAFNFHRYHNYDLVYMYHPIQDKKLYAELVNTILGRMRKGSILLEVLPNTIEDMIRNNQIKSNISVEIVEYFRRDVIILRKD